jgi:hypothetical protein
VRKSCPYFWVRLFFEEQIFVFKQAILWKRLVGFGFLLVLSSILIPGSIAIDKHTESAHNSHSKTTNFQPIEQPLANKITVTLGGVGLISLELWWFLLSKSKTKKNDL